MKKFYDKIFSLSLFKKFLTIPVLGKLLTYEVLSYLFFGVMTWVIDYSPIGVAGLLEVTGGANILDFECAYSVDACYQMLEALGESGRTFHLTKIMPTDIVFPFAMMLFNFTMLSILLRQLTKEDSTLRLLPILAIVDMLLDWTENIGITVMLINYPVKMNLICKITSIVSTVKFACVLAIYASIILLLLVLMLKKIVRVIRRQ